MTRVFISYSAELEAADISILLISPDFMASDYCYGIEMKRAMERHPPPRRPSHLPQLTVVEVETLQRDTAMRARVVSPQAFVDTP